MRAPRPPGEVQAPAVYSLGEGDPEPTLRIAGVRAPRPVLRRVKPPPVRPWTPLRDEEGELSGDRALPGTPGGECFTLP